MVSPDNTLIYVEKINLIYITLSSRRSNNVSAKKGYT